MSRPILAQDRMKTVRSLPSPTAHHKTVGCGLFVTDEIAGLDGTSETCFQNCSPIRTCCPGPAAQMSSNIDGCWTAVCRRAVI